MLKRFSLLILIIVNVVQLGAQSVGYTYRPFADEGCTVIYTPTIVNDTAYIVVNVKSDRLMFNDNPSMLVRFFDDKTLQLQGKKFGVTLSEGGVIVGYVFIPTKSYCATSWFMVTEEQMDLFSQGVAKIRLNTQPIMHERTFKKDKIGIPLFQNYHEVKEKVENF